MNITYIIVDLIADSILTYLFFYVFCKNYTIAFICSFFLFLKTIIYMVCVKYTNIDFTYELKRIAGVTK